MKTLLEKIVPLTRKEVEDFTDEWYAIQDGEDKEYTQSNGKDINYKDIYNNPSKKRAAFDDLYDRATNATFKGWPLTDEALKVMRQIWLETGFEGFDGTDEPFKALVTVFNENKVDTNSDAHLELLLRMMFGTNEFDTSDYKRIQGSKVLQGLLAENDSLYKYPASDIAVGLEAIDKIVNDEPNDWPDIVFADGGKNGYKSELNDLRMLANGNAADRSGYIKVEKMKEKSVEEIAKVAKQLGLDLSNKDDAQLLVDTGNAALKQIASKK